MELIDRVRLGLCKIRNGKYIILTQKLLNIDNMLYDSVLCETEFLNRYSPKLSDRIKYILQNKQEVNTCNFCNSYVLDLNKKYCSAKCNNNSEETKNKFRESYNTLSTEEKQLRNTKRTKTVNEKYGGYTLQSAQLSSKMRQTMKNRYGVEHSIQNKKLKQKAKDTCIEKYGVDNPFRSEAVKDLIREVLIEKYGVDRACYINQSERVKKATQTKIERGLTRSDEFLTEYQKYSREVRKLTEKTYKDWEHVINVNNVRRTKSGRKGYQLDHKYSILEGFLNDVEPSVMSSRYNLQIVPWEVNIQKSSNCVISLDELTKLINDEV